MAACDIVDVIGGYLSLKKRGDNFLGLCPFHNERTPSFSVSASRQMFKCFGCGKAGNVISFIMQIENFDFALALELLASRANIELPKKSETAPSYNSKRFLEANLNAARFFFENLSKKKSDALERMNLRMIRRFGIGLSDDSSFASLYRHLKTSGFSDSELLNSGLISVSKNNKIIDFFRKRLMFPVIDLSGKVVGFGGRALQDEQPKYLNTPKTPVFDKSSVLYGANIAKKTRKGVYIICEGYMDVIALHEHEFPEAIGVLGSALTEKHILTLRRLDANKIYLAFDADDAGKAATLRSIEILRGSGLRVLVVSLPFGYKDPDELLRKVGANAFREALSNARPAPLYQIDSARAKLDIENPEERAQFLKEAAKIISRLEPVERDVYAGEISETFGISKEALLSQNAQNQAPIKRAFEIKQEKGVIAAKNELCRLILSDAQIAKKVKSALAPEELGGIYEKLAEIAYSERETPIGIAEITSHFHTVQEQNEVANILFSNENDLGTLEINILETLNESVKLIRISHFNKKLENLRKSGVIDAREIKRLSVEAHNADRKYFEENL